MYILNESPPNLDRISKSIEISLADPPTVPKFPYFVPESRSIIRQYELSDFVTEIRKFWVYDIIDIPET